MAGGASLDGTPMKDGKPYFVGTENATKRVTHYVKPGRTRAPFLRYFKFNLPRTTKVILLLLIAGVGGAAFALSRGALLAFPGANIALTIVAILAAIFVLLGIVTKLRIWDFGLVPALGAVLIYVGGIRSATAPYVWNGASTELAATYTLMLLLACVYVVFYWALNYGMIVAYPDDQHFHD